MSPVIEGMSAVVCVQATSSGPTNAIGQNFTVSLESTDMTAGEILYDLKYTYIHKVNDISFSYFSERNGLFGPYSF